MPADNCTLWHDDTDWYWASDLEHLAQLIKETCGDSYEEMCGDPLEECWNSYNGKFTFSGGSLEELPSPLPENAEVKHVDGIFEVHASVDDWRKVSKPGFFASTEW